MDEYLKRLQDALASATEGLSTEQLNWHCDRKWSIAEALEHLYLTYTGTEKGFRRCRDAGRPLAGSRNLRQRVMQALVLEVGYFPSGRQAPEMTRPRGLPVAEIMAKIGPQVAAMDAIITDCEARYGSRNHLIDHPILGPLTARQWRKFHWIHGQHHIKQILRLRGEHGM